jgi:hypothetical protein
MWCFRNHTSLKMASLRRNRTFINVQHQEALWMLQHGCEVADMFCVIRHKVWNLLRCRQLCMTLLHFARWFMKRRSSFTHISWQDVKGRTEKTRARNAFSNHIRRTYGAREISILQDPFPVVNEIYNTLERGEPHCAAVSHTSLQQHSTLLISVLKLVCIGSSNGRLTKRRA